MEKPLLGPRGTEQRELLVGDRDAVVALGVVLLLFANDGVRETVGEADGGDVVVRSAVRGAVVVLWVKASQ